MHICVSVNISVNKPPSPLVNLVLQRRQVTTENLAHAVKIAALWMFLGFDLTLVFTLKDFDPESVGLGHMVAGLTSQQVSLILLGDAAIRLAPFGLAVLTLILKEASSRLLNLALGTVFAVASMVGLATLFTQLSYATPYLLLTQVASIAPTVMIVRYAYRWPKGTQ